MIGRRRFLGGCLLGAAAASWPRLLRASRHEGLARRVDEAVTAGVRFLAAKQGADGAWRSEMYGPFKDGPSLTSLIGATLAALPGDAVARSASERAVRYLARMVSANGRVIEEGITYPVYTAAGAVMAMARFEKRESGTLTPALSQRERDPDTTVRNGWLRYLRERQLTEDPGWSPANEAYGGWSYAQDKPRPVDGKPATPLSAPNLSATVFAIDALRASGCCSDDPAIQKALVFIARCQNWNDEPGLREAEFDDGGFFFIVEDPQRNKAGVAGTDGMGRTRYASYGSATADGVRALAACGVSSDQPRMIAARRWLNTHFSPEEHAGEYSSGRKHLRPAVYFYYCASVARAFCEFGGPKNWAAELATELLRRQAGYGSWANRVVEMREDDPLVATTFAIQALDYCRKQL